MDGAGGSLGGMAGSEATGGKASGGGGQVIDPGELDGSVAAELIDVLAGGSAEIVVSLERSKGFKGIVLVSLDGEPFRATQVFASPNDDQIALTIEAAPDTEQGYYEVSVLAESTDGVLSVEIPVTIRVRGAPWTLDLTFGDRERPWVREATQAEVAVDDAGYVYLRNQETIFRFDQRGVLDESFEPEGLGTQVGPMMGMENGVLIGTRGPAVPDQLIHFLGTGEKDPDWSGNAPPNILLLNLPWSLHRRDGRVVVAADYAYPFSWIQVFSMDGPIDPSFQEIYYYSSSGATSIQARIDSQGRVIVAPDPTTEGGPLRRLLPDGTLDTSFADDGELILAGENPKVLDFEVLEDDGLAILVETDNAYSLTIWSPSSSGGIVQSQPAEYPRYLLRLPGDRLLVIGNATRWPQFYARLYSGSGERLPLPGPDNSINLSDLLVESVPEASASADMQEPSYDPKSHRLVMTGLSQETQYLWSMWL